MYACNQATLHLAMSDSLIIVHQCLHTISFKKIDPRLLNWVCKFLLKRAQMSMIMANLWASTLCICGHQNDSSYLNKNLNYIKLINFCMLYMLQESVSLSVNIGWHGGVHVQTCGHYVHMNCHSSYMDSLKVRNKR